ncbi:MULTISPECIES: DUF4291 domain-containing protein [unclassified Variovorax]|uniref:DUF4291 domain-containing protein n=1 Tax=unclassified Variovorax TaxID=663243 RepID=UPI003F45EBB1
MNAPLPTESHLTQRARWPQSGQHILAHHDAASVVVYQAYRPAIGEYAIRHGRLDGPDFSLSRMSWIKPNFLWMMYRCGWGAKEGQEVTLGLRLRRAFFERVVREAVPSTFNLNYPSREAWQAAVESSEVRLQWDPDHSPSGHKLERRAIQLGLRGRTLAAFAHEELLEVIDMRAFVDAQRPLAQNDNPELQLPVEHPLDIGT